MTQDMTPRSRSLRRWRWLTATLILVAANCAAQEWRFDGVERWVAIGDVHGAYDELTTLLQDAGVVDAELDWSGGATHLVSMGDLVDRGPRSREVVDLMMRLEQEAAAAGGKVHVLLGNHEAMQLSGETENTTETEFAAFAGDEDPARRAAAYQRYLAFRGLGDDEAATAEFAQTFPPGFFGHQAAYEADGRYGQWILKRPVAVVVNGTLFVHGGVSDDLARGDLQTLNQAWSTDLEVYARAFAGLRDAGVLNETTPFSDRAELAVSATAADGEELAVLAEQLAQAGVSPIFTADGPLWNRGTAWCNPNFEVFRVDRVLAAIGAERAVIGHTPTVDAQIRSRMDERVYMIDTGMLAAVYQGQPTALIEEQGRRRSLAAGELRPVTPQERRVGSRPGQLTDDELEVILREGKITAIEDVGEGVTKPLKVTIRHDDVEVQGLFKSESTEISRGRRSERTRLINLSDRWQHEVAAYRVDRMIGLELVPVTVERTVNGRQGSLSFWINGLTNEMKREEESLTATGWCSLTEQWPLMFIFDALIYNDDRTKQNMAYGRDDWMMYLIDHSRSFRTLKGRPPDIAAVKLKLSPRLAEALERLEGDALQASLGGLLERSQIRAVLQRRDEILRDWRKSR